MTKLTKKQLTSLEKLNDQLLLAKQAGDTKTMNLIKKVITRIKAISQS